MNGMTAKEAAEKWGISPRQVQLLCAKGRISGATRFGHAWLIPGDTEKPLDGRRRKKENDKGVQDKK